MVQLYREECQGIALPLSCTLAFTCLMIVSHALTQLRFRRVLYSSKSLHKYVTNRKTHTYTYIPTLRSRQTAVIQKIKGSLGNNSIVKLQCLLLTLAVIASPHETWF